MRHDLGSFEGLVGDRVEVPGEVAWGVFGRGGYIPDDGLGGRWKWDGDELLGEGLGPGVLSFGVESQAVIGPIGLEGG